MTNKRLMFFRPVFKEKVWGGSRLKDIYKDDTDKCTDADHIGECWAVSAQPGNESICLTCGAEGEPLSKLWQEEPELFGNYNCDRFPLLLKIIDAKEDLSIQVHPSDAYAKVHENGSFGKKECWYVMDAPADGKVVIGHNAKTREEFKKEVEAGDFDNLIRLKNIKRGDFVKIEPGTLHAIKGGTMVLEIQQNSDITYRFYDYDRIVDGSKRELHIEKALDVVSMDSTDDVVWATGNNTGVETLYGCEYFKVSKAKVDYKLSFDMGDAPFYVAACVDGSGTADGIAVKCGTCFIIPNGHKITEFSGDMTIILACPV